MVKTQQFLVSCAGALPAVHILKTSSTQLSPHKCLICGLTFDSESDLSLHCLSSEKFIQCAGCNNKFLTVKGMKQHYGKKHAVSRPYKCTICLRRFRNVYACRIHRQQVHFHSARKNCGLCGKSVFNQYSMKRHLVICSKLRMDLLENS